MDTPKYKVFNSRHFKRLRVSYLLKFSDLKTKEAPFISNIKDLSAGGVHFWTDQVLTEGTFLKLTIMIPPMGRVLETLGRVQRVRYAPKYGIYYIGIGFIELSSEDRAALNQFIEETLEKEEERLSKQNRPVVTRFSPFQPIA